jgi:hypothetical protein
MSGLRITKNLSDFSHMRSQLICVRNNNNTLFELSVHQEWVFMLFYCSNANIREFIVIYVLN